jgi:hypothetical protein
VRCQVSILGAHGGGAITREAIAVDEVGDDPVRWLVLGPDRAGNLPELVVIDRPAGPAVIHAMPMRATYRRLLPKGRREQT